MNEQCSWEVRLRRSLPLRSSNWNKFNSVKSAFIFILLPLCIHPPPLEQKKAPLWRPWTQSKDHASAAACRVLLILPPCVSFTAYLFLCSSAKSIKLNRSCSSRSSLSLWLDKKNRLWNQRGSQNGCPSGSRHPPLLLNLPHSLLTH